MIGEVARTGEFKRQFDWPDAVIHLSFDFPEVSRILTDLNGDPHDWERLAATMFGRPRSGTIGCIEFGSRSMPLGLAPAEAMQAHAERVDQIASKA